MGPRVRVYAAQTNIPLILGVYLTDLWSGALRFITGLIRNTLIIVL
jgi:hypothetical protein